MISTALNVLQKPEDDCDIVGKSIAAKLRKMDDVQRIHAEKLFNDVIYKGMLHKLSEYNYIADGVPSSRNSHTPSTVSNESNDYFSNNYFTPINYP